MRINFKFLFCGLLLLAATSCTSYKKTIYMQNDQHFNQEAVSQLYDFRIMPKDELTILVSTTDPSASAPFYRKLGQAKTEGYSSQYGFQNVELASYLVDNEGRVDFPVLGMLKVMGMTTRECEALIREKLKPYLNEVPNVTVRNANYKFSVMGEVKNPGTYVAKNEKVTVFEALSMAGDMTLFSVRDDVQLLREDAAGKRQIIHLNLTDANIANSPYFYLQQNDVIYVKPTKSRVSSNTLASNASFWLSLMGVLTSVTSLILVAVQR